MDGDAVAGLVFFVLLIFGAIVGIPALIKHAKKKEEERQQAREAKKDELGAHEVLPVGSFLGGLPGVRTGADITCAILDGALAFLQGKALQEVHRLPFEQIERVWVEKSTESADDYDEDSEGETHVCVCISWFDSGFNKHTARLATESVSEPNPHERGYDDEKKMNRMILADGQQEASRVASAINAYLTGHKKPEIPSVADEIEKLDRLFRDGILTKEELEHAKARYIGKPKAKNRAEEAIKIMRNLHSLHESGVLSDSEFKAKKWDILSKDVQ